MSIPPVPIIDSHIHLFPAAELATLAWNDPAHPLWKQHSVAEYRRAVSSAHDLVGGFVFVETDRRTAPDDGDSNDNKVVDPTKAPEDGGYSWKYPLQEVGFLARVATGRPRSEDEGHGPKDKDLCLGIVPWAPLPAGPDVLARYLAAVRDAAGPDVWGTSPQNNKIKGFRYLLQDKPDGTMLAPAFVAALRLLGREGFVFDVGVDLHRRGRGQLEEVVEMVERAHAGVDRPEDKVVFVLSRFTHLRLSSVRIKGRVANQTQKTDHLCKPDLTVPDPSADPGFLAWRSAIYTLSKADNVYMKLSGAFSEMAPSSLDLRPASAHDIFDAISPWLAVVVAAFGPERLMFGSDWPVCTIGVDSYKENPDENDDDEDDNGGAWDKWRKVVERLCSMSSFSEEETKMIFWGTAKKAYNIQAGKIY